MRKLFTFIASFLLLTSCVTNSWLNDKEYNYLSNTTREADMTQYMYLVDTIPFDSMNFCILNKQGVQNGSFYVSKSFLSNRKIIKDNDIFNANYSIFLFGIIHRPIDEYGCITFEDYSSGVPNNVYQQYAFNEEWNVLSMKKKPSFMRVYMIRGDFLRFIHQRIWDGGRFYDYSPCNKHAYYKVVVPAWK